MSCQKLTQNDRLPLVRPGVRFGALTVLERIPGKRSNWKVRCDCGVVKVMFHGGVRFSKSCGCLKKELLRKARTTHGMAILKTPTYIVWRAMRARCQKPSHKSYKDYGARGIKVCDSWKKFENFLADMGERPEGMQLDRVDNNGNYEPSNCRWATPMQNMNNRRTSHYVDFNGERRTLAQWSRVLGIGHDTLGFRLDHGWSVSEALTTPVKRQKNNRISLARAA